MSAYERILKRLREEGSLALHVDHRWERGEDEWKGIWCLDCQEWVVRPPNHD